MGRRYALGVAVGVVIAGIVWLALPAGREVRPAEAPTVENVAGSPSAPVPATVTAGGAGTTPPPAGGVTAGGVVIADAGSRGAAGGRAAGLPARDAARAGAGASAGERAGGGAADGSAAGEPPAAAAREPWQGTLALRGRLLDVAGKPIPKAKLRLYDGRPWPGAPPRPIVETDAEGRFAFVDLPSNRYQLFADVGAGETNVSWYLAPGQDPVDLTYRPAETEPDPPGTTRVRVVGHDGTKPARANVRMFKKNGMESYLTVVDGSFLRGPADGGATSYEVFEAHASDRTLLPLGPVTYTPASEEDDLVTLPPGRTLSGRVLGPDGQGVFGVEVAAEVPRPANPAMGIGGAPTHGRTFSDRDGRFRLTSLGEGSYDLTAVPLPPFVPGSSVRSASGADDAVLRVEKGAEAEITVLDVDGKPVAGAVVSAHSFGVGRRPQSGRGSGGQVTDSAGRARLTQLSPTVTYRLAVAPPSGRKDLSPFHDRKWDPKDTTVRLARAWLLRGSVQRADGAAGMSFVHRRLPNGTWLPMPTKKDGSFEVRISDPAPWVFSASLSHDTPRGTETTITDPSLPILLEAPVGASAPAK
jgi:hypothetical protein